MCSLAGVGARYCEGAHTAMECLHCNGTSRHTATNGVTGCGKAFRRPASAACGLRRWEGYDGSWLPTRRRGNHNDPASGHRGRHDACRAHSGGRHAVHPCGHVGSRRCHDRCGPAGRLPAC